MKISVEFPSVAYREGPAKVVDLARAIDAIGFDDLAMFDHVVMGYATETRAGADLPVADADPRGARDARVRRRRHRAGDAVDGGARAAPAPGRPRRQAGQHARHAVGRAHATRRRRRLAGGRVLRRSARTTRAAAVRWTSRSGCCARAGATSASSSGASAFHADTIAMEPKPPQGAALPIWVGGTGPAALRRAGELGDGWMGIGRGAPTTTSGRRSPRSARHAEAAGRDPTPSACRRCSRRRRTTAPARTSTPTTIASSPAPSRCRDLGFGWLAMNATAIFQAGARTVDEMIEHLAALHTRLRAALG